MLPVPRVLALSCSQLLQQTAQAAVCSLCFIQRRTVWSDAPGEEERSSRESFYDETVEAYAQQPCAKITLRRMLEFGRSAWYDENKIIESAEFARQELPKRLARRLMDLQLLPYIVVTNPHIKRVYDCYFHAFNTLIGFGPITSKARNEHFSQVLRRLVDEHAPMLDSLASGLRECRRKPIVGQQLSLDDFLENMLRSRISRRVLAEQHLNLHNTRPGYIGVIATDLSIAESVDLAAGRCRQVCIETYGAAPEVLVSGDTELTIPYIPAHLDYMLYELLKNSARAVVERQQRAQQAQKGGTGSASSSVDSLSLFEDTPYGRPIAAPAPWRRLPPVLVRICNSDEQVTIRISDQGGGIPREEEDKVWQYGFTTTEQSTRRPGGNGSSEGLGLDNQPPAGMSLGGVAGMGPAGVSQRYRMAGLGFGLPLSRLYARYFGGDLTLVNMAGYGVDAFLTLRRLSAEWQEAPSDQGVEPLRSNGARGEASSPVAVVAAAAVSAA